MRNESTGGAVERLSFFEHVQKHKRALLLIAGLLTASGAALMLSLPVSLFPDITFPRIVILADNGEEPAERMLVEVTKPIEEVVNSVPGVHVVRSVTSRGSAEISVYLNWGTNVLQALQILQGKIENIRNTLPPTASINAQQMSVAVFPIEGYSLSSDKLSLVELRDIALLQIRPTLLQVPGVARVEVTGGDTREFLVTVNPTKLAQYHLDVRAVSDAIKKSNIVASTGLVDNNYQLYLSLISGLLKNTDEIGAVPVTVQNGAVILVRDVAQVTPSVQDQFIRATAHGHDAVLINVIKQPTGSSVEIGQQVIEKLSHMKFASQVHFENFYDQATYIAASIASTRDSILIGILLSMLVLMLFLRSWRITLVMMVIVPATIAATFLCLFAINETINIMTLGGIAAAVGLIIDDSIVVIESIFAQFTLRRSRNEEGNVSFVVACREALHEIMPAVIGSTASTIVIHIPLGFLSGIAGAFFRSLSITMVFAMLISFIFSITLAPLLASMVLREKDIEREVKKETRKTWLGGWYERLMYKLLKYKLAVVPLAFVIVYCTYLLYANLGSSFMPEMDEGAFVLDYSSPPGTSLTETNRMLVNVEKLIMKIPEVESYSRRTGTQLGFFLTEPNRGDYTIKLKQKRTRGIDAVMAEARTKIESSEPRLRIDFGQMLQDVIGDLTNSPSPIEIKLFGADPKLLERTGSLIKDQIGSVRGVVDAFNGVVISGPSLVVNVNPMRASLFGLTSSDIQDQLSTMITGRVESNVQHNDKVIGIRVRYPNGFRRDMDSIGNIMLLSPTGVLVPLANVASIDRTAGQPELNREGLRPYLAVTARISGRDLGSTIAEIQKTLQSKIVLPKGVTLEYGGVYQTEQESFKNLLIVALVAFLFVFIVLILEFREFAIPFAIIIITVLSLLGVMAALSVTGMTLNISSFVGLIMLIGIVAENAIFIMHYVKLPENQAGGLVGAIVEASRQRIRPIAMTTLAAVLALLPLALAIGEGAQMQQSLAIAVIGGFSVSSVMLFFILPMLYALFTPNKKVPMRPALVPSSVVGGETRFTAE
jgi:CzcA family heavy metal efflux pump